MGRETAAGVDGHREDPVGRETTGDGEDGAMTKSRAPMGTLYDLVGGDQWFVDLVDRFYERVAQEPLLKSMYPEDLTAPKAHLAGFLVQYWGGPAHYSEERGHPRLRMRHVPFEIGPAERDAWFDAMSAALSEGGLEPEVEQEVRTYFRNAADHLRNA